MFGLGAPELLLILGIIVIIFGVGKLPEVGSALGRSIREFKGSISGDHDDKPIVTEINEGESTKVETTVTATPVDPDKPRETSAGS